MTRESVEECFNTYIDNFNVKDLITFEFATNTVAPTSVIHSNCDNTSRVIIGLPIQYREERIIGVLDHEIGTHFLRRYNEKRQIWFRKRGKYNLEPHIKNEEGLAVLNQSISQALRPNSRPFLFMAALHYVAAIMAQQMSFQELYHSLNEFLDDPEKRY